MFDIDKWQEIWITITRNKMRSMLTAFGVFWGIFMLVIMSGAGWVLENGIMSGVKDFAHNSCYFFTNRTTVAYDGFRKGRWWSLHSSDMEVLKQSFPEIRLISPILFGTWSEKNTMRGDKYGTYSIKGLSPDYQYIEPQTMLYGRYINNVDILNTRKVCVIGKRVYEEMFQPGENPLGQLLQINGIAYSVVGVNIPVTQIQIGGRSEESIILPFSTMQQSYRRGDNIDCIALAAYDSTPVSEIEDVIKNVLKKQNHISPDDLQAVMSMNVEKEFTMFNNLFSGISWLIWIVGTGTLLAGIVGVSNIMLVTVKERTKEIGIRRALGARPRTIIIQIMGESLLLTSVAGFAGLAAGVGLLQLVDMMLQSVPSETMFFRSPQISFGTAMAATAVLLIAGMLAGMLPAWRALQIKAIDAIREE
jgi:hypothetical protein